MQYIYCPYISVILFHKISHIFHKISHGFDVRHVIVVPIYSVCFLMKVKMIRF